MKKIQITFLLICLVQALAAQYNNGWIDYSKQYYKIKIGSTGFYRLPKSILDNAGLGSTEAQYFQLWRNGAQVPLFTSVANGSLGSSDYIEFYGQKNDGTLDHSIYRVPSSQLTDKVSLFTDTSVYFLTVDKTNTNKRYTIIGNDVETNSLPAAPNVWSTLRYDYINTLTGRPYVNKGFAKDYGEYVYSSSFDTSGEMLSSNDIYPDQNGGIYSNSAASFNNVMAYAGGEAKLTISLAHSAALTNPRSRPVRISLNGTAIGQPDFFTQEAKLVTIDHLSTSLLQQNTTVKVENLSTNVNDRVVAGFVEIEYPRQPNASGQASMSFFLPATSASTYLEISNFNHGNIAPILYNVTLDQRIESKLAADGKVRLVIPASNTTQQFVLISQSAISTVAANNITPRILIDYSKLQGDYLIITNNLLLQAGSNNPVAQYAQYRTSLIGGGYNAKIYDIEQLVDQFAFGIKMHPLAVKNFLKYARQWTPKPRFCFLIGKGVTYDEYREKENSPLASKLLLVPTFGYPASDNILASDDLTANTVTPIGRLNVVYDTEVEDYLNKVKEYEAQQATASPLQADKSWMKNIIHVVGANDPGTAQAIKYYTDNMERIIEDTLYGGNVTTFNKFNTTTATTIEDAKLNNLFQTGFSLLLYFGHSSATTLDYNLEDPTKYNNPSKYPMFMLLGCNAGNFFNFDEPRLQLKSTISEKYVLTPNRGAIAMIASTHFGLVGGLGTYSNEFYESIAYKKYGEPIGNNLQQTISELYNSSPGAAGDYSIRIHNEEQTLHGDPALRMNSSAKPDYSIESQNLIINPAFISIAEAKFNVKAYYYNIGKAINDSITIKVIRTYPKTDINPNGASATTLFRHKAALYIDSVSVDMPIVAERDKGTAKITIVIDADNEVDELSETNNTISTDVVIYEDELRPVYPVNYAIVNQPSTMLRASTSNPFSSTVKTYLMEMDTTALFNSPLKVAKSATSSGGVVEFDPGTVLKDGTAYYWRLAMQPVGGGQPDHWNNSTFTYLAGTDSGFNQSHLYQHTKSTASHIFIDSTSRTWKFVTRNNNLYVANAVYNHSYNDDQDLTTYIDQKAIVTGTCVGHATTFVVFDPITMKPMRNYPGGLYGSSLNTCDTVNFTRQYNFSWNDLDVNNRNNMAAFMRDGIPNGSYVVVKKTLDEPFGNEAYADILKSDGLGKSFYSMLKDSAGFTSLDSFNRPRTYIFIYKKNDKANFSPVWVLSEGLEDKITLSSLCPTPDSLGFIASPTFGPALKWKKALWNGNSQDTKGGDLPQVNVVGVKNDGTENLLYTLQVADQNFDISNVSATDYPYIKLEMRNSDSLNGTPYNLNWWRLYYSPVPEGALAANVLLNAKDTLETGEAFNFEIAFKNIGQATFPDSLVVQASIRDKNNNLKSFILPKEKSRLISGDTVIVTFSIDTKDFPGLNTLYIEVNPNQAQPEQYFFNNFLYKNFYVKEDSFNPLLDVTFDGQHILNQDIVSSKPHIQIKLKDENKYLALNDPSALSIQLQFPNGDVKTYNWDTDTLKFTPATVSNTDNTATIDFTPVLSEAEEGSEYTLTVSGKDRVNNPTGYLKYSIKFQVFNKPMISNMLNYPNPFSTSTAFVFTLTGSEVPQELKIQILTITGKIVREITKPELGPLHIGTNITEFKWDGTDTYGSKLANGVYLYRVISSLDGNKMTKFRLNDGYQQDSQDQTDKFFKKGYGKMVILR